VRRYNKKLFRQFTRATKRASVESRDSIVWDIDLDNYYARVKIQGSNEFIIAHFPRNTRSLPKWLKVGNSVRIVHKGGLQGYVEIVGPGRAIPTAVSGSSQPVTGLLLDGVVSGMTVSASDPPTMILYVASGSYRLDNSIYYFNATGGQDPMTMSASSPYVLGIQVGGDYLEMGGAIFGGVESVSIATPPAEGSFRYDRLAIGADGTLDYLQGSTFTSTVSYPAIPADHIQIGPDILIVGGTTAVNEDSIGRIWTARDLATLQFTPSGGEDTMDWSEVTDTPTKTIYIYAKDQYNWSFSSTQYIQVEFMLGSGRIIYDGESYYENDIFTKEGNYSSIYFTYERDQLATHEVYPVFRATVRGTSGIEMVYCLTLLDVDGGPLYGS
jgi:hypothetical protein